jgi:phosphoribosylformimino-5-aminoimidazole carboxamide ribotide isomerase
MWIPAIDLSNGQSVRLYQGDFDQKTLINADPLTQAQAIEQAGLTALHLVDLDGAKAGNPQNLAVIKQLVAQTNLAIELGGGIRSLEQIRQFLELGISRVIIGSAAIKQPEMVQQAVAEFGDAKVVVGVDGRHEMVATHGWLDTATGFDGRAD